MSSLIKTCKLNEIDPQEYLTDVLERIVSGSTKINRLHELFPWEWKCAREATELKDAAGNAGSVQLGGSASGDFRRVACIGIDLFVDDAQRHFVQIGPQGSIEFG